jgi:quercetin dioxygenase-like cupin family protein
VLPGDVQCVDEHEEEYMYVGNVDSVAERVLEEPDMAGIFARALITNGPSGQGSIALTRSEMPPGTAHLLHRHPTGEQAIYVEGGVVELLSEGEPVQIAAGGFGFFPRNEWHGVRNASANPAVTLTILVPVGGAEEPGYEPHPEQFSR